MEEGGAAGYTIEWGGGMLGSPRRLLHLAAGRRQTLNLGITFIVAPKTGSLVQSLKLLRREGSGSNMLQEC